MADFVVPKRDFVVPNRDFVVLKRDFVVPNPASLNSC